MQKVHLRVSSKNSWAMCGYNERRQKAIFTYEPKRFRMENPAERCQHCEKLYLKTRNKQRDKKGLKPVDTAFENQKCWENQNI